MNRWASWATNYSMKWVTLTEWLCSDKLILSIKILRWRKMSQIENGENGSGILLHEGRDPEFLQSWHTLKLKHFLNIGKWLLPLTTDASVPPTDHNVSFQLLPLWHIFKSVKRSNNVIHHKRNNIHAQPIPLTRRQQPSTRLRRHNLWQSLTYTECRYISVDKKHNNIHWLCVRQHALNHFL